MCVCVCVFVKYLSEGTGDFNRHFTHEDRKRELKATTAAKGPFNSYYHEFATSKKLYLQTPNMKPEVEEKPTAYLPKPRY